MDGFEKIYGEYPTENFFINASSQSIWQAKKNVWQEAARQKAAEIVHLRTIIENLEMSVKSFTDGGHDIFEIGRADGVKQERKRIADALRKRAEKSSISLNNKRLYSAEGIIMRKLADRLESEKPMTEKEK